MYPKAKSDQVTAMHFIYILQSITFPDKVYVGYTLDIEGRLQVHNSGGSIYTAESKPWELIWHCEFKDKLQALAFEKYLKSHSGRAFMSKRLIKSK